MYPLCSFYFYVFPGVREYIKAAQMVHIKAAQRVQITYTLEAVVQLTCTIVHPNCQLCVHSFEKDTTVAQQPSWNLGYIDVSWLQRHRLVYHGVCTLWRYLSNAHALGTTWDIPRCPRVFLGLLGPGTSECQSLGHHGISRDIPG